MNDFVSPLDLLSQVEDQSAQNLGTAEEELQNAIRIMSQAQKSRFMRDQRTSPFEGDERYAVAAGLLQPTRSGRFGETFGNVVNNMREVNAAKTKYNLESEDQLYGTASELAKMRYDRLKHIEELQAKEARARIMAQRMMMSDEVDLAKQGMRRDETGRITVDPEFKKELRGEVAPEEMETEPEIAAAAGIPTKVPNPYRNLRDPKSVDRMTMTLRNNAEKRLEKLRESNAGKSGLIEDLNRFIELNSKDITSPAYRSELLKGAATLVDSDLREADSIASKIVPTMRVPGSGATSDFDAKMFTNATFGVSTQKEANENIANAMLLQNQRDLEYQDYLEKYFNTHGHLDGAENYWKDYVNKNPIFDPKSKKPKLNTKIKSYQEFFKQGTGKEAVAVPVGNEEASVGDDELLLSRIPKERVEAALKRGFTKQQIIQHLKDNLPQEE